MIDGVVSGDGAPLVSLTLAGRQCRSVVDTGFNGSLELPEVFRELLPVVPMGTVRSELAAGIVVEEESFMVRISFDGEMVLAQVTFAPVVEGWVDVVEHHGPEALRDVWLEVLSGKSAPRAGNIVTF